MFMHSFWACGFIFNVKCKLKKNKQTKRNWHLDCVSLNIGTVWCGEKSRDQKIFYQQSSFSGWKWLRSAASHDHLSHPPPSHYQWPSGFPEGGCVGYWSSERGNGFRVAPLGKVPGLHQLSPLIRKWVTPLALSCTVAPKSHPCRLQLSSMSAVA